MAAFSDILMTELVSPPVEEALPGAAPVWTKQEVNRIPINFTDEQYIDHMRHALSKGFLALDDMAPPRPESLLICGNGPSLAMSVTRLKKLVKRGHKVVACNNAYEFLKGRVPVWAQAAMDARPETAKTLGHGDDIAYLICSLCHPLTIDVVAGKRVLLWHTYHSEELADRALREFPGVPLQMMGGGCTITLRMINVGYAMGFRDFQLYGVDSCFYNNRQYAAPHNAYGSLIKSRVGGPDGREFVTSPQMLEQVLSFQAVVRDWPFKNARLSVHGEGMLVEVMREAKRRERLNVG